MDKETNENGLGTTQSPLATEGSFFHKSIKDLAEDDRPREKMLKDGAKSLSNSELLAILICNGTKNKTAVEVCQELLDKVDNNLKRLFETDWRTMTKVNGIGMAKAVTIKAALEIGVRVPREEKKVIRIGSSDDLYYYIRPDLEYLDHEEIWVVFVRRNNSIISKQRYSMGSKHNTIFDLKTIMRDSLSMNADGLFLVHNHPSGSSRPSGDDRKITRMLKQACEYMDTRFLDHLIIGDNEFYSFADKHELELL